MSWPQEPHRHALARRGIRTRTIPNPEARSDWWDKKYEGFVEEKGVRKFIGSGLEDMDREEIVEWVHDYINLMIEISQERGNPLDMEIKSIYLVGSRVAGFHEEKSDLDIVVVFKDDFYKDYNEKKEALIWKYYKDAWGWSLEDISYPDFFSEDIDIDIVDWKLPDPEAPQLLIWEAP